MQNDKDLKCIVCGAEENCSLKMMKDDDRKSCYAIVHCKACEEKGKAERWEVEATFKITKPTAALQKIDREEMESEVASIISKIENCYPSSFEEVEELMQLFIADETVSRPAIALALIRLKIIFLRKNSMI